MMNKARISGLIYLKHIYLLIVLNDIGNNESLAINDTDGNPITVSGSIFSTLVSSSISLRTIPIIADENFLYSFENSQISSSQPGFVTFAKDSDGILRTPIVSPSGFNFITGSVTLEDGSGSKRLATIDESLRLRVAFAPPSPPPATTPVAISGLSEVGGTPINTFYTIPNGQTLFIQRFSGGGQGGTDSSVVELFYDPNGNLTGMTLLRAGYVSGNNFEFTFNTEVVNFLGNNTRRIVMRRRRLDGGNREIAGFWDGYLL
jgi:hypothetical protein